VYGRSRVRIPGWTNVTQLCKRFSFASTSTQVAVGLWRRDGFRKLFTSLPRRNTASIIMGIGSRGAVPPSLNFYTWYRYSRQRLYSVEIFLPTPLSIVKVWFWFDYLAKLTSLLVYSMRMKASFIPWTLLKNWLITVVVCVTNSINCIFCFTVDNVCIHGYGGWSGAKTRKLWVRFNHYFWQERHGSDGWKSKVGESLIFFFLNLLRLVPFILLCPKFTASSVLGTDQIPVQCAVPNTSLKLSKNVGYRKPNPFPKTSSI